MDVSGSKKGGIAAIGDRCQEKEVQKTGERSQNIKQRMLVHLAPNFILSCFFRNRNMALLTDIPLDSGSSPE